MVVYVHLLSGAFSCDWTLRSVLVLPRRGLRVTRGIRMAGRTEETRKDEPAAWLVVKTHTCRWEPPGSSWPSAGHFLLRESSWAGLRDRVEWTCNFKKNKMQRESRKFQTSLRRSRFIQHTLTNICCVFLYVHWLSDLSAALYILAGPAAPFAGGPSSLPVSAAPRGKCVFLSGAAASAAPAARCTITHTIIPLKSAVKLTTPAIRKTALSSTAVAHGLFFTVHDGLQLLKMTQLYLQLLHLGFHQQSHERFDLPLFYCCQMLQRRQAKNNPQNKAKKKTPRYLSVCL